MTPLSILGVIFFTTLLRQIKYMPTTVCTPSTVLSVNELVAVVCIIWSTYYDQTHWVVCLLLQTLWIQRFIGAAKNLLFNGGHLKPIPPTHSTIWHYWQIASVIWYILVLVCREIWLSQYYIASRVEVLAKVNTIEYIYKTVLKVRQIT